MVYNFILHGVEHMQLCVGAMLIRPSMFKCKPFSLCWKTVSIYTFWYIHTTWQCRHAYYHISCRICLFFSILTTMYCFIMPMFFTHIKTCVRTHIYLYSHLQIHRYRETLENMYNIYNIYNIYKQSLFNQI